jgi:hypothetical protein
LLRNEEFDYKDDQEDTLPAGKDLIVCRTKYREPSRKWEGFFLRPRVGAHQQK